MNAQMRRLALPLLGIVGAVAMSGCADGGTDEVSTYEAGKQCERFLEDRLKSPATADFDLSTTGGPDTFTSTGSVDSENGFGANVRSDVSCTITLTGDTWHLDDWDITTR